MALPPATSVTPQQEMELIVRRSGDEGLSVLYLLLRPRAQQGGPSERQEMARQIRLEPVRAKEVRVPEGAGGRRANTRSGTADLEDSGYRGGNSKPDDQGTGYDGGQTTPD